jgi:RNA polymerase subunit RPABC4/transcription elongation factor Spt4
MKLKMPYLKSCPKCDTNIITDEEKCPFCGGELKEGMDL